MLNPSSYFSMRRREKMRRKEKIEMEKWKYNMGISYINDAEQQIEIIRRRTERKTMLYEDLTMALFYLGIAKKFLRED